MANCELFLRAEELAEEKGLGEAPEMRRCPFGNYCDGIFCPQIESLPGTSVPTGEERFMRRLEETAEKKGLLPEK